MRIVIASDSHGSKPVLEAILKKNNPDIFIFCGDGIKDIPEEFTGRLYSVGGNMDEHFRDSEILTDICGKKILIVHGHSYSVKSTLVMLKKRALDVGADVVFFGHTHCTCDTYNGSVRLINPGSAALGSFALWDNFPEGDLLLEEQRVRLSNAEDF